MSACFYSFSLFFSQQNCIRDRCKNTKPCGLPLFSQCVSWQTALPLYFIVGFYQQQTKSVLPVFLCVLIQYYWKKGAPSKCTSIQLASGVWDQFELDPSPGQIYVSNFPIIPCLVACTLPMHSKVLIKTLKHAEYLGMLITRLQGVSCCVFNGEPTVSAGNANSKQ